MYNHTDNNNNNNKNSKDDDNDLKDAKAILTIIQNKTFKIIFGFILFGLLVCFFLQFWYNEKLNYTIAAEIWNVFVSLLLGIIATIVSLISLFFSFYNTKQSYDSAYNSLQQLMSITTKLESSEKKQEEYLQTLHSIDKNFNDKISLLESTLKQSFNSVEKSLQDVKDYFNHQTMVSPQWEKISDDEDS